MQINLQELWKSTHKSCNILDPGGPLPIAGQVEMIDGLYN